jgi:pimeloyl-ACP methyl ester carboxylesterase
MTVRPIRQASVEIGLDRFEYTEAGEGPPLIFLHGAPGDRHVWDEHVGLLSDRYRCLAYTQRSFGDAAWRDDGPAFSTATHAADLVAFADMLALRPFTLVAWSYSAHVALQAIIENPGLVTQAILFDLGTGGHIADAAQFDVYRRDVESMLSLALHSPIRRPTQPRGSKQPQPNPPQLPGENLETIVTPISRDALQGIDVPVSIWWGGLSRQAFRLPSETAASLIRFGSHRQVEGVDHEWPRHNARQFCAQIRSALLSGRSSDESVGRGG